MLPPLYLESESNQLQTHARAPSEVDVRRSQPQFTANSFATPRLHELCGLLHVILSHRSTGPSGDVFATLKFIWVPLYI